MNKVHGIVFLFVALTSLSSCKAREGTKAERQANRELQSEKACMQNVFKAVEILTQNYSGGEYGALQMNELSELNVSGCPAKFRDNFSSVLKILEQTQELQMADVSLKADQNLNDPRVLSALKRITKPDNEPITTVENAEKALSRALDDNKKSMEGYLRKLIEIAAKYSIEIE